MKRWLALLLVAPFAAMAQEPELGLRLSRRGDSPVWFGQHVGITAILRTPVRFASPPVFPDLTFEGRAIALPNGSSTPGSERESGRSYVLLQHVYDVFPAQAGRLIIRPLALSVPVGTEAGEVATVEARSAPLELEVRLPPGTGDPARLVTTPSLRLSVGLEGEPTRMPVGEALTRTVTLVAKDSSAMLLPPMPWAAPEGVRAYPDPPRLTDHADRGVLSATRVDRAAFVPERPGRYELPGASLQWFEPGSGRMQTLSVPPLLLEAVPVATAAEPRGTWRSWGLWAGVAGSLVPLGALGWWMLARRPRPANPEADSFAALRKACRSDDARAAMAALLRWTALASPSGMPPTVASLAALTAVPSLETEASALAQRLYGSSRPEAGWNGAGLLAAAHAARRQARRTLVPAWHQSDHLPALNPAHATRPAPRVTLPGWAR